MYAWQIKRLLMIVNIYLFCWLQYNSVTLHNDYHYNYWDTDWTVTIQ